MLETPGMAIYMGAGPSAMYASYAIVHGFIELTGLAPSPNRNMDVRLKMLPHPLAAAALLAEGNVISL